MKKGCKSYKVNPKNSYISSKNFLVAKGAIDKYLNIIDLNGFRKEVVELTKLAKNKHNVDKGLLFGERTIYSANKPYFQAVPNKDAFSEIDKLKTTTQLQAQPQEDLSDFYMGDQALREQAERELGQEFYDPAYVYGIPLFYNEKDLKKKLSSKTGEAISNIESNIPFEKQKDRALRIGLGKTLKESIGEGSLIEDKKTGQLYVYSSSESAAEVYRGEQLLSYYEDNLNPSDFFIFNFDPVTVNDKGEIIADDIDKISPLFGVNEENLFKYFAIVGEVQKPSQNQELFLYLSKEMSDKLGYNNPGSTAAPSIKDIITRIPVINQTDIDNKKLEC